MTPNIRWAFNILKWEPTERELLLATQCLQVEEKNRIDRFVFKDDAKATLVGRLLIRKFVSESTNMPYNSIELTRNANHKPIYKTKNFGDTAVSFNVSHHGSYTVLAGELGEKDIGVDVMKLDYNSGKTLDEFFRIMNRNFSASEWRRIRGTTTTPEKEQIDRFCRNWALKESYVKATGVGVAFDLQRLNFDIIDDIKMNSITSSTCLYIDNEKQEWLFEESLIDPLHCVAVALKKIDIDGSKYSINDIVFKEINSSQLLENAVPFLPEDHHFCKRYFQKEYKNYQRK